MDHFHVTREDVCSENLWTGQRDILDLQQQTFWEEPVFACFKTTLSRLCRVFLESNFVSAKVEIFHVHGVVFLAPLNPKCCLRIHRMVWQRTRGLLEPSLPFSHNASSSGMDRVLDAFGRLPFPSCRSSFACPSRTFFDCWNWRSFYYRVRIVSLS